MADTEDAADQLEKAIGLMSGTSLDGIDAAFLVTDGVRVAPDRDSHVLTVPYDPAFRERLRKCLYTGACKRAVSASPDLEAVERDLTDLHAAAVAKLLAAEAEAGGDSGLPVSVCGFHGHTVAHRVEGVAGRFTHQLGDGRRLAARLSLPCVFDFRTADVAAGGQGAPLAPLYHAALATSTRLPAGSPLRRSPGSADAAAALPLPVVVLNIGGVANVSWLGPGSAALLRRRVGQPAVDPPAVAAFDVGPGNAQLDDWVLRSTAGRQAFDADGGLAAAGEVHAGALAALLARADRFLEAAPPKSLDREDFATRGVLRAAEAPAAGASAAGTPPFALSLEDGAATLTALTAECCARAADHLPAPARAWLVTGGGRRNPVLMAELQRRVSARAQQPVAVVPVEAAGWDGDSLEAEAFAFLAVRRLRGLPTSLAETTGVPTAVCGGQLARPGDE